MSMPRLFIACSSKSLSTARVIQSALSDVAKVKIWDEDVFRPGAYTLEGLLQISKEIDLCICLFNDDDTIVINEEEFAIPRDNVLLEFGLFVSLLDRDRVIIIQPSKIVNNLRLRVPSDLTGLTTLRYNNDDIRGTEELRSTLGPACTTIREIIKKNSRRKTVYIERFKKAKEPALRENNTLSKTRIYELLIYMFEQENFTEFRAFDLAFNRWEESVRDEDQTENITAKIFQSLEFLFSRVHRNGRAQLTFKRILVIPEIDFQKELTKMVLNKFIDFENQWNSKTDKLKVETKILVYKAQNAFLRNKCTRYYDYAIFSGEDGEFAIIEKLSSPQDKIANPDCGIEYDEEKLKERKASFDEWWTRAEKISVVIAQQSKNAPSRNSPIHAAFELISKNLVGRNLTNVCIIIEANYVDMREPYSAERRQHTFDAYNLLDQIQRHMPELNGNIIIDAFINDFSLSANDNTESCNKEHCKIEDTVQGEERRKTIKSMIVDQLRFLKKTFHISDANFIVTGMKQTRNSVTERLQNALKDEKKKSYFEPDFNDDRILNAVYRNQTINLGYYKNNTVFIPRCTLLMAEHYFNLFEQAVKRYENLTELWLIDFNTSKEAVSVLQGAKVSFLMHTWQPDNVRVNIINCNYESNGRDGFIEITRGPKE